ncbi:DUF2505 domain-containing protein [Arsenicicoccus piscis]|uniref:DUF2505 domain-containing protein n=1 Tax=Arsenicicoccus piscis TaxID=673954 RepID=A0ABQ6HLL7_9MICO|nr:DUF2505 domain-containing protein [Arsenicicoccus piscis]MCH8628302.1 DUF2505 domain-containing protein [Arsenicicoccus piscis]GMA18563.1 hypothetical protein GCM10025862_05840 [Arsenicicoccus piscis]
MRITREVEFTATPDQVYAMLADPAFHEQVAADSDAVTSSVTVEPDGDTLVTELSRELSTEGMSLPSILSASTLTVRTTQRWGAADASGRRTGTLEVQVVGTPLTFQGDLVLEPGGAGTRESIDGELRANVPLVGKKIEQAAAPAIEAGMRAEHRTGERYLAEHAG